MLNNIQQQTDQHIFITLGDPKSINIEILCQCLNSQYLNASKTNKTKLVLIGSKSAWLEQSPIFLQSSNKFSFVDNAADFQAAFSAKQQNIFYDVDSILAHSNASQDYTNAYRGEVMCASLEVLKSSVYYCLETQASFAVLTLPIDKSLAHQAGFSFDGHTEFLESIANSPAIMTLVSDQMKVAIATNHLALSQVASAINEDVLIKKLELLVDGLQKTFHISKPSIAVCGLNPHCGDGGDFGTEEQKIVKAIEHVQKNHHDVEISGPVSADTVFYQHLNKKYDAVLAMYHDQGLIPIKTVSFNTAVNVSLGLPFLRVSPDHGPATDIFLEKKADAGSLKTCFDIITKYFQG